LSGSAKKTIEAEAAVRLRDQFISIASHELRTPLMPLKLSNDMLLHMHHDGSLANYSPESLRRLLETNDAQILRLTRLIDDMLDVSRISSGNFELSLEEFDLCSAIDNLVSAFSGELERAGCTVKVSGCGPIYVNWDRLRIDQVFGNILRNALIYAPGKDIDIRVRSRGERVFVSVRDYGIGIAPNDLERIFVRFERASSARHYGGLGLGLYIAQQIVNAHQGVIRVKSRVGRGTTFTVVMPRVASLSSVSFLSE
jgi:two-component system, OmpR family, sensor kinase